MITLLPKEQPPPNPHGIPVADPAFHKPLYKMAKMLLKPKQRNIVKIKHKARKKRRKAFY